MAFEIINLLTYLLNSCIDLYNLLYMFVFIDYPQSGAVYNFGHVCLSDDKIRKLCRRKFTFAHPVYLQGVRVKFVYEGHWVKVKVTAAER